MKPCGGMSIVWSFMVNGIERLVSRQAMEEQVRQGSQTEMSYLSPMGDSERGVLILMAIGLNRIRKRLANP